MDVREAVADSISESDRGAIILAGTGVEDTLEYQIYERLPGLKHDEEARKRLFDNDGSVASFSKKLWMAYAMGIVDKDYRKKIDLIREIRNACAHSRKPISMKTTVLQAACKAVIKDTLADLKDQSPKTLRDAFVVKCSLINHYIHTGEKIEGMEAQVRHLGKLLKAEKPQA